MAIAARRERCEPSDMARRDDGTIDLFVDPSVATTTADTLGATRCAEIAVPVPVDKPFTYYGKYRFRLAKDGYETLVVEQRVRSPWYELPGLDFFSENLIPWTIRDVRHFTYVLQPAQVRSPEQLLLEAQLLRDYGRTIGEPLPPDLNPPAGAPPTVLMPPVSNP